MIHPLEQSIKKIGFKRERREYKGKAYYKMTHPQHGTFFYLYRKRTTGFAGQVMTPQYLGADSTRLLEIEKDLQNEIDNPTVT